MTAAYINALTVLPIISSATRRGDRSALPERPVLPSARRPGSLLVVVVAASPVTVPTATSVVLLNRSR